MKGMPPPVINSLEACCMVGKSLPLNVSLGKRHPGAHGIAGEISEIRSKLELVFASAGPSSRDRLRRALDELAGIVKLLGCISIGKKVLFRPTLAHNAEVSLCNRPSSVVLDADIASYSEEVSCSNVSERAEGGMYSPMVAGEYQACHTRSQIDDVGTTLCWNISTLPEATTRPPTVSACQSLSSTWTFLA